MYCSDCGADNKGTASFCRKCGVRLDGDDETRVAGRRELDDETVLAARDEEQTTLRQRTETPVFRPMPAATKESEPVGVRESAPPSRSSYGDDDMEIFSISPTLMFVKGGYVLAALGAVLLVALVSALAASLVPTTIAVLLGLGLLLLPAYYHLKKRLVRYVLTETKLQIDTGLIARETRNVPLRRIQDVTVTTSILQRLLGFGDIVVDNASEDGGKLVLDDIDSPRKYADMLLRQMSRLDR